ncbi:MAG: hypothetical protein M0Q49_03550 [Porticoccaceae bacterium]|nr:hypothetical protein [Porticoccaceae bacterium]
MTQSLLGWSRLGEVVAHRPAGRAGPAAAAAQQTLAAPERRGRDMTVGRAQQTSPPTQPVVVVGRPPLAETARRPLVPPQGAPGSPWRAWASAERLQRARRQPSVGAVVVATVPTAPGPQTRAGRVAAGRAGLLWGRSPEMGRMASPTPVAAGAALQTAAPRRRRRAAMEAPASLL